MERINLQWLNKLKIVLGKLYSIESIIKNQILIDRVSENARKSTVIGTCLFDSEYYSKTPVVVSLTTYNKRIYDVYLSIESMLNQTIKPNKIILWLSEDEFDLDKLPIVLRKQQERGLEIRFCEDLKSYKKLLPTLKEYNDFNIITIDDDFIYPYDFVENLLRTHNKYPDCVCYYRGVRIGIRNHQINTYVKWMESKEEYLPSILNFATGAGGVLYPKGCFDSNILDIKKIFDLAPYADDIWFKAMTLLNDIKYVKVVLPVSFDSKFVLLDNMQDIALHHKNVTKKLNDIQLNAVFKEFGLYSKLFK